MVSQLSKNYRNWEYTHRDLELLITRASSTATDGGSDSPSPSSSPVTTPSNNHSGQAAFYKVFRIWAYKKFMTGWITLYISWRFVHFVDGLFSPICGLMGIDIFGLGFITLLTIIFSVGICMSSWLGTSVLSFGELFIRSMPLVSYIYAASKQISTAISPDEGTSTFKEVAIIRHPRIGEYAFGIITSSVVLQKSQQGDEEQLSCIYVPTNHLYTGDMFLISPKDVMKTNLSVREGIEIVISGGMSKPKILKTMDAQNITKDRTDK